MGYWDAVAPSLVMLCLAVAILPWLSRDAAPVRIALLCVCLILAWRYIGWRVFDTLPPASAPVDFGFGVVFVILEVLTVAGNSATMIFLMRLRDRSDEVRRNLAGLESRSGPMPRIDVLICTYNEDRDILERTIIGATGIDYPNFRVWVCNDGRRPWLRALCAEQGVGYLDRPTNAHAKAGNINAALENLKALDEPPEFISILDADFVPLPPFLKRTVALMRDPRVAVVQTPQHFFNEDPVQSNLALSKVFPDEQRYFFDVVMASKDAWGAAFCCGTSSLIRFEAVCSVGGFPTDSVTEDYLLSLRLRQAGYQTVYLNEPLSLGLAPEGLAEYTCQRGRWCLGFVQICMGASSPLRFGNKLPMIDRIMLLETFMYWAAAHSFRLFGIVIPALYLLFDIQAVHTSVIDAVDHVLPYFTVQVVVFAWLTRGRILPVLSDLYQMLCAHEIVRAVLSGLLQPQGQKFKVTAKGGSRDRRFYQWPLLRVFGGLAALLGAGILYAFVLDPSRPLAESSSVALFWSWYNLFVLLLACYVCIEQPRYRQTDRFATDEIAMIRSGSETLYFRACDISVGGMQFVGRAPWPIGQEIEVRLGRDVVMAQIQRRTADGFAVSFAPTLHNRIRMTRRVFSGNYSRGIGHIHSGKVAQTIMARLLR
jgi:cellulose synthase/poly-beta-1,6-N-acetylglucosamine synthase-like glycosyltransferase